MGPGATAFHSRPPQLTILIGRPSASSSGEVISTALPAAIRAAVQRAANASLKSHLLPEPHPLARPYAIDKRFALLISARLFLWMCHGITAPPAERHFRMHLVDSILQRVIGSQQCVDLSDFRKNGPCLRANLSTIGPAMHVLRLRVSPRIDARTHWGREHATPSCFEQLASLLAARTIARFWQSYRNVYGDHRIELAFDLINEHPTALASIGACNRSMGCGRHFSVQDHQTAHAGLRPESAPILTLPARTTARGRRAFCFCPSLPPRGRGACKSRSNSG